MKEIAFRKWLWGFVKMSGLSVGLILSAITDDFCIALPMRGSQKGFKILSWKTTALVSLGLPVCLFVGQNSRATEKIFIAFYIHAIYIRACKFALKSDKVVDIVTEKYRKTWMLCCEYFDHILQGMWDYIEKRKKM